MKKYLIVLLLILLSDCSFSQVTNLGAGYQIVDLGKGVAFAKQVILLHEMYNGSNVANNYAVGNIVAIRGSVAANHRLNIVNINTGSAYNSTSASIQSFDNNDSWKLKTCIYNGIKYLALEVPFSNAHHDWGLKFSGWRASSNESLKLVTFEINGVPVNTDLLSNIQDYVPNMVEKHLVSQLSVSGNLGIGTTNTQGYKLAVAGNMIAESINVKVQSTWPDYVFEDDYNLPTLKEIESQIKSEGHLSDLPSSQDVKNNGVDVGELNLKLLKKIEELTLHLINLEKKNDALAKALNELVGND
ncbi:hypothetical protein [Arcticibacter sp.]|uniref:hypothetical protein n=1 Tax=Arcticibacter sp. TaxID=1872630 RepID=UPI00388D656D